MNQAQQFIKLFAKQGLSVPQATAILDLFADHKVGLAWAMTDGSYVDMDPSGPFEVK